MKIYKSLFAIITIALFLTGCDIQPPPPQPSTSAAVKLVGDNQAELTSGQLLSLTTVRWVYNYYRLDLPGPFPLRTGRLFAFDGQHVTLTVWKPWVSYRTVTGEIVGIDESGITEQYSINVANVGDKDSADDGSISVARTKADTVQVTWPVWDTRVI